MKKTKNTSLVAGHFGLHLSRAKALELMLAGIIRSGHITLSRIASCCGSSAEIKSSERRFSRFLEAIDINWECWAKQIIKNLTLCSKKRYNLIIDRTDWKIGAQAVNLLVVALQSDSWACPLCVLPIGQTQSTGNSTVEQIYKVLACAQKALGKRLVSSILGDREFGTIKGIQAYKELGLSYCVRLKDQWYYARLSAEGAPFLLHEAFDNLEVGRSRSLRGVLLGLGSSVETDVSAKRLVDGNLLIVAHSAQKEKPLKSYRKRWKIERLFLEIKTQGFHLESSRVMKPKRQSNLLAIVSLAVSIVLAKGKQSLAKPGASPTRMKKHGFPEKSVFKRGFEALRALLWREALFFVG